MICTCDHCHGDRAIQMLIYYYYYYYYYYLENHMQCALTQLNYVISLCQLADCCVTNGIYVNIYISMNLVFFKMFNVKHFCCRNIFSAWVCMSSRNNEILN